MTDEELEAEGIPPGLDPGELNKGLRRLLKHERTCLHASEAKIEELLNAQMKTMQETFDKVLFQASHAHASGARSLDMAGSAQGAARPTLQPAASAPLSKMP